jgi:hypothetical protein
VFRAHLDMLESIRSELIADVLELVATDPLPDVPGQQTKGRLHERREPRWRTLYETLLAVVDYIGERQEPGSKRSWTIKSWGLVLDHGRSYDAIPVMTHSHWGYTWSSVLWLDVPTALADSGFGGTAFRDPLSFVRRGTGEGEGIWHHAPPSVLDLVVFPSYLEHLPSPPPPVTVFDRPRVVVATDFLLS